MIEIGKYGWKKFIYGVFLNFVRLFRLSLFVNWMSSFNSAVAQNKEHLLEMLNRQSVSTVYNLIKFIYRKTTKYAKYKQICKNVAKYVKTCKNAKNNMQIFKLF